MEVASFYCLLYICKDKKHKLSFSYYCKLISIQVVKHMSSAVP